MESTNPTHPHGKPISVLKFGEGKNFIVDNTEMENIFMHPDVKDRKVVVLSIMGAFRKGKSFFLNYCLRYMYANYPSINYRNNPTDDSKNWMGLDTEPLQGFTWRSGIKRATNGFVMWSDVFLHTVASTGENIAIVLMDTQGLFDNDTSSVDNSRVFQLGILISSIQILNLMQNIQEDQLQYLQFATEFSRFASQDSDDSTEKVEKPFQHLMFLIRDWQNPDEHEFGFKGGREYIEEVLKLKTEQKGDLKSAREYIMSSFEKVDCCLMPHPGKAVARIKTYDGQWKLMDEDFKGELVTTIENLLHHENLVLKKINGKDLIGSELKAYMESYFELFQSDTLPEAETIYDSTIAKQMSILMTMCRDSYKENFIINLNLLQKEVLEKAHDMSTTKAFELFNNEKKMGNAEHEKKYKAQLEIDLKKEYAEWNDRSIKIQENSENEKPATPAPVVDKESEPEQENLEKKITELKQQELDRQIELQLIEKEKFELGKSLAEAQSELLRERARADENQSEKEAAMRLNVALNTYVEQLRNQLKTIQDSPKTSV